MMTVDNKMVFNEIIVYVFVGLFCISTGLVGWLCLKTVDLSEKSTAIIEQNKNMESRMAEFRAGTSGVPGSQGQGAGPYHQP